MEGAEVTQSEACSTVRLHNPRLLALKVSEKSVQWGLNTLQGGLTDFVFLKKKIRNGAGKMVWWVEMLAPKPDDLSQSCKTQMVRRQS